MFKQWNLRYFLKLNNYISRKLFSDDRYEVGKRYWCGYWCKSYKVIAVKYVCGNHLQYVVVEWDDGRVSEHSTPLDIAHDLELLPMSA